MRSLLLAGSFGVVALTTVAGCATTPYEEATGEHGSAIQEPAATEPAPSAPSCTEATTCAGIEPRAADPNRCTLLVVFDGSGVYSSDANSNVGTMYKEAKGATTTSVYIEGVPALPFGQSAERVDRGRSAICQHLAARAADSCDIVMLGYSRGAFIANEVAHALNEHGCMDGSHKGQRIAFLGAFDPVNTQMGSEWEDERTETDHAWYGHVPSNVDNVLQVYKDPKEDPRGGIEGLTLTTSLLSTGAVVSSCSAAMTKANHPSKTEWHHGEVGHGELPKNTMKCGLERAGIRLF